MRESTIFYKSFYDSIKLLPKRNQLAFYEELFEYIFNDVEPKRLAGGSMALFKALKPQIDVNNKRYENGCKGGRPKANQAKTKTKPNDNQSKTKPITKTEPNYNHNYNSNQNHNQNDNDNALGSSGGGCDYGCDDEFNIWKMLSPEDVDAIYEVYPESGGALIDEVYAEVKKTRRKVKDPVAYILGYAKNVEWQDTVDL